MGQLTFEGTEKVRMKSVKHKQKSQIVFHHTSSQDPLKILQEVEDTYHRDKFYVMTSGGKDSQTVLDFVNSVGKLEAVVHIKTNIGLSMTTNFVKDFCQSRGYPIHVIEPKPKFVYVSQALEEGFPGPSQHGIIMWYLKLKAMREFALSINPEKHCLVTGVRKYESHRRMGKYLTPIQNNGRLWFVSPYYFKSDEEVYKEFLTKNLPISPAYKKGFHTSGECLCGAFGTRKEKEEIKRVDPHLAEFIEWIELGIKKFGTDKARKFGTWGGTIDMEELDNQQTLEEWAAAESMICGAECGVGTMKEWETNPVNV